MPKLREHDIRDLARYTPGEAAHHLSVPVSTIRAWAVGIKRPGTQDEGTKFQAVIRPAGREPLSLSFWNLVELYVLTSLRRRHQVPMPEVRKALLYTARELQVERPLLDQTFYTDGVDIFVERYAQLVRTSDGQLAMKELLEATLARVDRGADGKVQRLFPWLMEPKEPHFVEIDPERAFGRLVLSGTGVPVQSISERFGAGESIAELAADYRMSSAQIEQALRWEQIAPRVA